MEFGRSDALVIMALTGLLFVARSPSALAGADSASAPMTAGAVIGAAIAAVALYLVGKVAYVAAAPVLSAGATAFDR